MRHSVTRRPVVGCLFLLVIILGIIGYISIYNNTEETFEPWYAREAPCKTPPDVILDMVELAARLDKVLTNLNIHHFVCYGTLWGVLRNEAILPWDNNVDFCAINEDIINNDENWLYRMLKKYDLVGTYNTWEGSYDVTFRKAKGRITLFQSDSELSMGRLGLERKLHPQLHVKYHDFPSWMVMKPLPKGKLHGLNVPIPRGEADILKHHYPDDWWKEMKPKGCK